MTELEVVIVAHVLLRRLRNVGFRSLKKAVTLATVEPESNRLVKGPESGKEAQVIT